MTYVDDKAIAINALRAAVEAIEEELGVTPSGVYADVRIRLDILEARINNPNAPAPNAENPFFIGNTGVTVSVGDGYPTENRVDGSLYLRTDGYVNEGLYSRRSGAWKLINTDPWVGTGDLSGTYNSQTVIGIQGNSVSSTTPTDGQTLTWSSATSNWRPLSSAVVFGTTIPDTNIKGNRSGYSSITDNTKFGITNLGSNSSTTDNFTTISGGENNSTDFQYSTISGGKDNQINQITGYISEGYSVICGGQTNVVDQASHSAILSGDNNVVGDNVTAIGYSTILGGSFNKNYSLFSCVLSGFSNEISTSSGGAFIAAGGFNKISGTSSSSVILSGVGNEIYSDISFISTGSTNIVNGNYTTILSGDTNTINGNFNTIAGSNNLIDSNNCVILGSTNSANDVTSSYLFINGFNNTINTASYSNVFGSNNNVQNGNAYTTIIGDFSEVGVDSPYSIITGTYGKAIRPGQIVQSVGTFSSVAGEVQYSKVILHGAGAAGAAFDLKIPYDNSNIAFEDNKSYDISLRILVVDDAVGTACARFVHDILAYQTGGTLIIDEDNATLVSPNGTGWTITISTSSDEIVITVNAAGMVSRRAIATVEWREISRI